MDVQLEISQIVKSELERGKLKNSRFSLRSLALRMKVSPSLLSDLIAGKRRVSYSSAEKILNNLSVTREDTVKILKQIGPLSRDRNHQKPTSQISFNQLEMDEFHILSDWHYFAVYVLGELATFRPDAAWISKTLGIAKREASSAVERLLNTGLFVKDSAGKIVSVSKSITTTKDISSLAVQKRHRQNLERAELALEEVSVADRDFSSIVMASHPRKLNEAKLKIENFRRELCQFLEDVPASEKTEVYQFNLQLFPLVKIKKEVKK